MTTLQRVRVVTQLKAPFVDAPGAPTTPFVRRWLESGTMMPWQTARAIDRDFALFSKMAGETEAQDGAGLSDGETLARAWLFLRDGLILNERRGES